MNSKFVPFPPEVPCIHQFEIPPSGSFPPTVIKNGSRAKGAVPQCALVMWTSFHFELWEGQSVSEVFAGVQLAGSLAGVVRGQGPLA